MQFDDIRDIVIRHGRLDAPDGPLDADANLYDLGLSSLTTVHVMLALEEHFGVEFPPAMLGRRTFESLRAIEEALAELAGGPG